MYWLARTTNPASTRTRLVAVMTVAAALAVIAIVLALTSPTVAPTFRLKEFSQNRYTATVKYMVDGAFNSDYDLWLLYSPAADQETYVVYQIPPRQMTNGEHTEIVPIFPSEGGGTIKFYAAPSRASQVLSAMSYTGNTAVEGYRYANREELPAGLIPLDKQAYTDPATE